MGPAKRWKCPSTARQKRVIFAILHDNQSAVAFSIYRLGYVKGGSTAFRVQKVGCGVPSAARSLLGPEGLLIQ